jgi:hypothetical protein
MNAVNKSISSSNITLSTNLSASGYISASSFRLPNNALVSQLTSSGLISSSGTISGSELHIVNDAKVKGDITSLKTGSFEYLQAGKNISASRHIYAQSYKGALGKQLITYEGGIIKIGTVSSQFPTLLYGELTVNGGISASGHLHTSASDADGSHDNVLLYNTTTGKIYHTGSYRPPIQYTDLDWNITPSLLTSSRPANITASSTVAALNIDDDYEGSNYEDTVKFWKSTSKKVSISGNGKMNINPLTSEYGTSISEGSSAEYNSNFLFPNTTLTVSPDISLNVNGKVRIKTTSLGQSRLYFEDSGGGVVHSIMNKTGSFSITNNATDYNPLTIHYHNRPDYTNNGSYGVSNRGGSIVFMVQDHNQTSMQGMRILGDSEYANWTNDSQGVQFGRYGDFGYSSDSSNTVGYSTNPHESGHVKGANVYGIMRASGDLIANDIVLTSDIRLKENIKTLELSMGILKKLKPRRFDWKEEKTHQFNDIGFIAQELQESFPELVTQDINKNLYVAYEKLTPILVKTLQSQIMTIESIEKRIEKLEQ